MAKPFGLTSIVEGAAAVYLAASVAIATAVLFIMVWAGARVVPGWTWIVVSALFAINVAVVAYRSLKTRRLKGLTGLIYGAGGLVFILVGLAVLSDASGHAFEAGRPGPGLLPELTAAAIQMVAAFLPMLMAVTGIMRSASPRD